MNAENTPPGALFDNLIESMPKMAEAVNSFALKDNQRVALQALLSAAGVPAVGANTETGSVPLSVVPPLSEVPINEAENDTADESDAPKPTRVRKATGKKTYSRVKDINFRPDGKVSLRDFVKEKAPSNNHERNLVYVYYLEQTLEIPKIEVGHVLSAYDEVNQKSPSIPDNYLMVTASTKGWLDTSDMKMIRTTHRGRNIIEYDMPTKKDTKSA